MATVQKAQPTPWCDAPLHLKFYVLNWETDKSRRFPVVFPSTAFVAALPCDMENFVLVGSIAVLNRKTGIWTSNSCASSSREIIHPLPYYVSEQIRKTCVLSDYIPPSATLYMHPSLSFPFALHMEDQTLFFTPPSQFPFLVKKVKIETER